MSPGALRSAAKGEQKFTNRLYFAFENVVYFRYADIICDFTESSPFGDPFT